MHSVQDLLTVADVMERLSVSKWTVYRLIKEREIVGVLVRGCRRVTVESLIAYQNRIMEDAV
ncbi:MULTISPECIES: helix-turn-helix domain-containing protein [Protofrankia]|nr:MULTISPECIES: helix-turn-helix domain-containing protein [Protofrankia]